MRASGDAEIRVELVDEAGATVGTAEKLAAHQAPGTLHRAFSVFLFDTRGRMVLQRRALSKYHSPGVLTNTCCGHPYPGEAPFLAATRRTVEELGVAPGSLRAAGTVTYRLPDPISGLVEYEFNHLFVGQLTEAPDPDPAEVAELVPVTGAELAKRREAEPFSAWFPVVLRAAEPTIAAAGLGWPAAG